jgi:hypothetical protein
MSFRVTNYVSYCPLGLTAIVNSVGETLAEVPLIGTTGSISTRRSRVAIFENQDLQTVNRFR